MTAVVKASQAISKEVTWDRLARRLLEVGLEQSGADRGCLIGVERGELVVAADGRADEHGVRTELLPSLPLAGSGRAPTSVVQFVGRTRERVLLADAAVSGSFAHDEYFGACRPRSLLCLPILRAAEVCAVLYLENERDCGGFTDERLTVLELIAAQGAIAYDNVQLIARLEQENVERRRAEACLEERCALLQQIIDNTTAVICMKDLAGRLLLVNRRFAELMHADVESMRGKTDYDYFSREQSDIFRASDLRVLRENRPLEVEETFEFGEGLQTYLSLKFPVADSAGRVCAICLISTDITGRKRAEERLRSSVSLLEATFDSTADGILVVDREGRLIQFNRKLADMLPSCAEMLRRRGHERPVLEAGLVREPEAYLARIRWLLAHPDANSLDIIELKDGRIFERYSQPQKLDGRAVGRVWSFRDVTTRVHAERERDRALLDERRSRGAAEEAVRLRDEFLVVASHELRTPLTSLQLAIERLGRQLSTGASPLVKRALEVCTRQSQRMASLVELLLEVGRVQAGRLALHRGRVDLGALAEDVTRQLAEDIARSGCEVTVQVEEPVVGSWDGARLEQAVINLLANALKFGAGRPIEIRVGRTDDTALLTLTDHGIGISSEAQAAIFERFGRAVSTRHYGGLGLGLFIARAIVEAHGGRVRVASIPGQGSTFTVELPLAA
nr:ATP-binding protein [Nannocystis pusilla]